MVFTFLLNFYAALVLWFTSHFPAYMGLPSGWADNISWVYGKVHSFDCLLPVSFIFTVTTLFLLIATPLLIIRFFMWLAKRKQGSVK